MATIEREQRRGDAAVLRRIWRLHFWVGLFAAPALITLACTGLIILYTQPLDHWLNGDLTTVSQGSAQVSLDDQIATARQHVGADMQFDAVTPPSAPDRSTQVDFVPTAGPEVGERNVTQVFVDPYTGRYLGQRHELDGLIGWANQLHRLFGNDGPTLALPSLGHLIAPSDYPDATITVGVGNLIMEITAVWILVLLASGIYLWWPRTIENGKPRLRIRWAKGGRIRWRDLHAATGILLSVVLICYIVSGLTWSRYWGENWRAVATTVTPSTEIDAPSTPAKLGDYDRLGRRIAWAAKDDPIYASQPGTSVAAPLGFAEIDQIAKSENMVPGYSIVPPADSTVDGKTVYGSYTVVNHWPQKLSEQRTLYLNQFTGATIANATAAQDGALTRLTSWGVDAHMGTQYGLLTRITATLACLGVLTSIITGAIMWWKRRPTGSAGLPGRTSDSMRANTPRGAVIAIAVIATALSVLYPAFGASLVLVLVIEGILSAVRGRQDTDEETVLPS
ncbi:PepSY domain-containing protein [Mycobacterium sp. M26]|uniref:PepSY-associated TM helix domain-containing protein n=1 Tax=Mycobacterium sp. M26 TaxID=1762962 RepID=UPI0009E9BFBE|nr:PepSY domain-containing protein [Mycobacterium sp. M26]